MKISFSTILNKLAYLLAFSIIVVALLVSVARFLTPVLNAHRSDFEKIASTYLQLPVTIHEVKVSWRGYAPAISLSGVTILDSDTKKPKLSIQQLEVDFSIWRSVWSRSFFIDNMTLCGIDLEISQKTPGHFQVGDLTNIDLKDAFTGESVKADAIVAWIFSQPRLALEDVRLHYVSEQDSHSVTLKKLALRNTPTHHVLDGQAVLNQAMPTLGEIHLGWDGDVRKLLEAKGHVYLYFEGLSLSQWFSKQTLGGFKITEGLASTKVWVRWDHNQIQKVQSEFNIYALTLYSTVQRRIEQINRIKAVVGWRRDGNTQVFAGDQILIDLPGHLWPATNFEVHAVDDGRGGLLLNQIQFTYVDLADVLRILLDSNVLTEQQRNMLLAYNPQGSAMAFSAKLPADLMDIQHLAVTGKVANLSINSWKQFPGVINFSGGVAWDGTYADIVIGSKQLSIVSNQFAKPLYFENVTAHARVDRAVDGSWSLYSKNLHVDNADLVFDTILGVTVPLSAEPNIDLTTTFRVMNAANIAAYLPIKIMDPDLTKWLRQAFLDGHTEAGSIVINGNLQNFPFDTSPATGKFFITTAVKDFNFNYGLGWPSIQHLNGQLTFAGSAMTVDVNSGTILDVPIVNVHGVIPYIGDKAPQILHVDGVLQGDAASGLRFIQQSPLRKTIGKDLSALTLTGPMQLKLGLVVPLKKPDDTRINGEVMLTNATLSMPDWRLQLVKLNGGFNFTENSIDAKNLTAEIFGEPATLQMTTLHDKGSAGQLRADLSSAISVASLQNWLNIKFNTVAAGRTLFNLQLFKSSHADATKQVDHVVVSSNLQGISLKAPKPYGKSLNEIKPLQIVINLSDSQILKTKVSYAKLFDAAVTLQKSANEFQLIELDLQAGVIDVLGTQFHQAQVKVMPENSIWKININSTELVGDLAVPFKLDTQAVEGHFQHVVIVPMGDIHQSFDPHLVPAMILDIDDLVYKNMKFGHLHLDLAPIKTGLMIKQLRIDQPTLKLNATGEWTQEKAANHSHIQGGMSAPNIGAVLAEWGFDSSSLVGSTGDVKFDLSWPDAPYLPSISALSGTLSLRLGEGQIVHLSDATNSKMGLGRLLNLLSLSSIPRRLSFDFSDLFGQGYSFDNMVSNFTFKNGNAYIEKMKFEGPVAGVNLRGRIGISAKDFDMQLGVTPHVTGSLPIVAAIAGGPVVGPIVGVATWLVERAVARAVSKSVTYSYAITGPWNNPVWAKLDATVTHKNISH